MVSGIGKRVYILGIGGISLSAIAKILKSEGHIVFGYDKTCSKTTQRLQDCGITVFYELKYEDCETVIYTSAIDDNIPLLNQYKINGVDVKTRAKALRLIADNFKTVVAVSGSHGKTTTSAMINSILLSSDANFTSHVGGEMADSGENCFIQGKDIFLTEACEYKRNFLELLPNISVVLNLDLDHTDCYPKESDLIDAFKIFIDNTKDVVVINKDDNRTKMLLAKISKSKKVVLFSLKDETCEYFAEYKYLKNVGFEVYVKHYGECVGRFIFKLSGEHNIYNVLASAVVCFLLGFSEKDIYKGVIEFCGVRRRFEHIGFINGARVVLDYAHHPREIEKVILQAKSFAEGKVYVVFQPHTYSRTKAFWGDFIKSLGKADSVVLYPIYPAREKPMLGVTSERMAEDLRRMKKVCYYNNSFSEIKTYLSYFLKNNDIVLIVGAGDIENFRNLL